MPFKWTQCSREQLLDAWATDLVFAYRPLNVIDFLSLREAFLERLEVTTIETKLRGAKWSKRVARFGMFSDDHEAHRETFHSENKTFSYEEYVDNPFVSYVLRDELSRFINTESILKGIRISSATNNAVAIRPREAILLTGSDYRLPFHLDGCETLLVAINGVRKISIMSNFADLFLRFPTRLHCQSYIPASFRHSADIAVHVLSEGEGIVIPPLVPHSVEAVGTSTLAYTAYVDCPKFQSEVDIGDLAVNE